MENTSGYMIKHDLEQTLWKYLNFVTCFCGGKISPHEIYKHLWYSQVLVVGHIDTRVCTH